jgi:hypothetical protein
MGIETGEQSASALQILECKEFVHGRTGESSQHRPDDAALLYPHVVKMVWRLVSRQGMDRPAADRMDASVLLDKFVAANAKNLASKDLIGSLVRDLELVEGSEEAEALLGLSKLRGNLKELRQISWRSFVLAYSRLRLSGMTNLSLLNEILEI